MRTYSLDFCSHCGKEQTICHIVDEDETFDLGGVMVTVPCDYHQCTVCGETYFTSNSRDTLALAYEKYKEITGQEWTGIYYKKTNTGVTK